MAQQKLPPRAVFAASSGNVLEWYDFTVYAFLAPIIGKTFFPETDPVASTLSAFAVLAVGYLARPVGSLIFGHIGDRIGRKPALIASVIITGAGSASIGLLPTYAAIGVAAPILLVLIRIAQGIAVAGEYTSSGILMVESVKPGLHHRAGAVITFAMMIGCMIGSGVPAAVGAILTDEQMASWGWRIPFILGVLVAITSLVLRIGMEETAPKGEEAAKDSPLIVAVKNHWRQMVDMILLLAPTAILYWIIFVYAASYLTSQMHISTATALNFSTINILIVALCIPPIGWLADKVGVRVLFFISAVFTLAGALPFWWMMHQPDTTLIFIGQMMLGIINATGWALSVSTVAMMMPKAVRCSGVSIGYNLSIAVFGGATPFVATYLVSRTGDDYAPAYYLLIAAALSLIAVRRLPRRADEFKY